jgi:hypothetical protein
MRRIGGGGVKFRDDLVDFNGVKCKYVPMNLPDPEFVRLLQTMNEVIKHQKVVLFETNNQIETLRRARSALFQIGEAGHIPHLKMRYHARGLMLWYQ